ncbi:Chloroperoxidase [Diplogelasinospora grovesii]|uniref:Chloroperoxidase n=1 Tax=Diplogelasinospora grovesii TaxID=303347 RepID=A0AAN6N8K0_9PEZI|nr:Chloroperoxidase [Diplogelasinospora grovesii]
MRLTVFGTLRGLLHFGSGDRDGEIATIKEEDHTYMKGNIADRGPCPGLNSLANQGYLPRDGKNITLPRVEAALMTALNMSPTLAHTLASQLKPLLHKDGTFDLVDMRRHNVIEHDVSFTRLDFRQGDNYSFQPAMFESMLRDADEDGQTTVKTLAQTYRRRTREEKASGASGLPLNLYFVSLVQTVSFLHTAETGGRLTKEVITEFYTQERFPEVITSNTHTRRLTGLVGMTLELMVYLIFRVK